jgi:anti-sigma B factor antagonist
VPIKQTTLRTSRIADRCYVMSINGQLDLDVAPAVRARLGTLTGAGASTIVLDLLDVPSIDPAGLAVLVDVAHELDAGRGELILVADSPKLTELLAGTDGDQPRRIETSLWEAVSHAVDGRDGTPGEAPRRHS